MRNRALAELLGECRKAGLHTTVDTCGHAAPKDFDRIAEFTDLFLYDLKHMDPELHRKYTGEDNSLILSNADYLLDAGAAVIFRIPVIPGINTSGEETGRMLFFLEQRSNRCREVHLLPYHRIAAQKYARLGMTNHLPDVKQPGEKMMADLKRRFEKTGLKVRVGG
jgi:pyruvate formate lyase activating enzyme